jgi:hypothetical protein
MRQLLLAVGAVCAATGFAGTANGQGNAMPGQIVGKGFTTAPVGQPIPKAGAPVGQPLNIPADSPNLRRYDPSRPYDVFKGTGLSANQLAAPIPGVSDQSTFDRLYEKLKSAVGLSKPGEMRAPNYTPGIGRRNRERADDRMWRRD